MDRYNLGRVGPDLVYRHLVGDRRVGQDTMDLDNTGLAVAAISRL